MKRAFLILYMISVASFFAGSLGFTWGVNLRFAVIAPLLVLAVVKSSQYPKRISAPVMLALWIFLAWCLLTCFWSENFTMSIVKLAIFGGVAIAFCLGGMLIPGDYPDLNPYLIAAPIFCYAVVGSILNPGVYMGNLSGVAGNSNMLGACILFSMPWYFVELNRSWSRKWVRAMLLLLGLAALVVLVLSRSRTMIISCVASSCLLFLSLKPGRKITLLYGLTVALMLAAISIPSLFSTVKQTYVLKSSTGVLDSRAEQMRDSYAYARLGGISGAGFGVSIGMGRYWEMGKTFGLYSREKGNSLFAVVEELGVIGLALWLLLFLVMAVEVRSLGRALGPASPTRLIYLLGLGYLIAAFVSSMAEAWVLSPSPETALFWAVVGLSIGTLKRDIEQPAALGRAA